MIDLFQLDGVSEEVEGLHSRLEVFDFSDSDVSGFVKALPPHLRKGTTGKKDIAIGGSYVALFTESQEVVVSKVLGGEYLASFDLSKDLLQMGIDTTCYVLNISCFVLELLEEGILTPETMDARGIASAIQGILRAEDGSVEGLTTNVVGANLFEVAYNGNPEVFFHVVHAKGKTHKKETRLVFSVPRGDYGSVELAYLSLVVVKP